MPAQETRADQALAGDPAPEWQFVIHTRYGIEHHRQADEHRAGPSCPCGPRIQWLGRGER